MDLAAQLRSSIQAQFLPTPSQSFLTSLVASRSPPPPLPALLASARARLLTADLTSRALVDASTGCFPSGVDSAGTQQQRLSRPIHVQVLDIENLSLSRWEQIEELEAIERGERTRGREIVRVTDEEQQQQQDGDGDGAQQTTRATGRNATHRLVLQDCRGTKVYALELRRINGLGGGKTAIGEKMMLKAGTVVARGMVMLEPDKCVLLGGKVDAWHKTWTEGRIAKLKEAVSGQDDRAG